MNNFSFDQVARLKAMAIMDYDMKLLNSQNLTDAERKASFLQLLKHRIEITRIEAEHHAMCFEKFKACADKFETKEDENKAQNMVLSLLRECATEEEAYQTAIDILYQTKNNN